MRRGGIQHEVRRAIGQVANASRRCNIYLWGTQRTRWVDMHECGRCRNVNVRERSRISRSAIYNIKYGTPGLQLIMTHVALVKHRAVDRVRNFTTDAAPKAAFRVNKRRVYTQALNSKLVCETTRINLKSAYYGL